MRKMTLATRERLGTAMQLSRPPRKPRRDPIQKPLFSSQAVTDDDVFAWIFAVAGIPRDSPRAATYARQYNVAEKVARAKSAGRFHQIINKEPSPCALF